MQTLLDVFQIILLFFAFAFIHSLMASLKIKSAIKEKFGNKIAFYRLIYNLISFLTFGLFLYFSPKPHQIVYEIPYPYDFIIFGLQILALLGLLWSIKYTNWKEFLGVSQIQKYFNQNYNEQWDENYSLRKDGPYQICRHPIYLFSILFIALKPYMTVFYFTLTLLIILYFYIGSYFEEKKLELLFGREYLEYKNQVSRIFPIKWLVKRLI
ncbi:MAG: isoprenylcysteine carboxylmethyltransferase family protein [Ignavibacteria bacterium]|nr:isoprenylcysteine carboxylmethyltransferase family protein [Ignavibacteria bacterium]